MGKRSKCKKAIDEDTANINSNNKVPNKKIKFEECEVSDTIAPASSPPQETKGTTHTKKQKNKSLPNEKVSVDDGETSETHSHLSEEKNDKTNKTVIGPLNDANRKKKNKREGLSQNDEEEVKESDIDQFCDELTEEDNVQYENWVKLIEAKLHSNIKKPK